MSKKRGLSLEEKREKILQIFYDSQDFYLLKELEKLGPKKGVISQSVKDVVQSLVDDDLVSKDKVGSSIYFWSLPSCAGNQLRNVHGKLESDLESSKKRFAELVEQRDGLKKGREDSDEREEALSELKAIETKYNTLKEEMGQYADNDPAALEAMKNAIDVAHAAANRWTDNIFTVKQWCSKNFPEAKDQLENLYNEAGISDDFDYLENVAIKKSRLENISPSNDLLERLQELQKSDVGTAMSTVENPFLVIWLLQFDGILYVPPDEIKNEHFDLINDRLYLESHIDKCWRLGALTHIES